MRSRYPSTSNFSASFGPGPLTPAIKALIIANVAAFLITLVAPAVTLRLGLRPADVFGALQLWQPLTYMFLHGNWLHLAGNNAYVTAVRAGGVVDTITPVESMAGQYGVAIVSDQDSVMINQSGIGRTAATIRLVKGSRADTIQISSYGRVLK